MFDWENAFALHAMQGNRATSLGEWGSLMDFIELRQARGVYSRVTMGMPILNRSLFIEIRTLV